jgi:hypothetical protein
MSRKKTRKRVRYRTLKLKLTARQKKSLDNFCRSRGTTPVKIIKKSIRPLLNNYAGMDSFHVQVAANQLDLFESLSVAEPSNELKKETTLENAV